jgi:hypothetical protein
MPATRTARLLCVARQCYQIDPGGAVGNAPDSDQIGYVAAPQGFVSGDREIDAALVGQSTDGILLGFRGTLPITAPDKLQAIRDWMLDLDAVLRPSADAKGHVHDGFLGALDALWPAAGPAVTDLIDKNPAMPVYVTGHSKGGAVANLAAMRLRAQRPNAAISVVTFAAARPGDPEFAAAYDAAIPRSVRYEYTDDIVPHLPPDQVFATMFSTMPPVASRVAHLMLGYASVGELRFIDWAGKIVPHSPLLTFERFRHLAVLMATGQFDAIVKDHGIDPGSGYATAIYALPQAPEV